MKPSALLLCCGLTLCLSLPLVRGGPAGPSAAEAPAPDPVTVAGGWCALVQLPAGEDEHSARLREALARLEAGRHAQAAARLLPLLARAPRAEAFLLQGLSFLERGQDGAAEGALCRAQQLAPQEWRAALGRAVALERLGHEEQARGQLERAFTLAPEQPLVRHYAATWQVQSPVR